MSVPSEGVDSIKRCGWWCFLAVLTICTLQYWYNSDLGEAVQDLKFLFGIGAIWSCGFVMGHKDRIELTERTK